MVAEGKPLILVIWFSLSLYLFFEIIGSYLNECQGKDGVFL